MLEINAAQSLIARITGIGIASAVFTYYLVKLLIKPYIDVRLAENPTLKFATNVATGTVGFLLSIALQIIAGVFTRRGVFFPAAAPVIEWQLSLSPAC